MSGIQKTWAVLKWLWDWPLRASLIVGVMAYIMTRHLAHRPWWVWLWATSMASIAAYFWQSALERAKERRGGK